MPELHPDIAAVLAGQGPGCLIRAECEAILPLVPDGSIDAIVTDPPAGIEFMGKKWDHKRGGRDKWIGWLTGIAAECLRVAKPGAHALVWALPRTSHWTATAWEDAGWEVRDRISHLFGSGFPKSLDVGKAIDRAAGAERETVGVYASHRSNTKAHANTKYAGELHTSGFITSPATDAAKQWSGWGTALKPACEDWWLLRKPLSEANIAANVLKHGTGALNIDGCRVGYESQTEFEMVRDRSGGKKGFAKNYVGQNGGKFLPEGTVTVNPQGRWPANVTHDGSPEVMEGFPDARSAGEYPSASHGTGRGRTYLPTKPQSELYADSGSAARFFYCAKASRSDRGGRSNKHPTVKPTKLMEWLIRLITPPGGIVLDCFAGSGSTLVAACRLGVRFLGIEGDADYAAIARRRIAAELVPGGRAEAMEPKPEDVPLFAERDTTTQLRLGEQDTTGAAQPSTKEPPDA